MMNLPLFFSAAFDLRQGILHLDEDTSRHCVQVLRMKPGESLQVTNGSGILLTAALLLENKKAATAKLIREESFPASHALKTIAISLVKNTSRLEWFLEKATEIGISQIIPLLCERTEKQQFRLDRMKNILVSAMLQSRQVWLPVLSEPVPFESVLTGGNHDQRFIAHCLETDRQSLVDSIDKARSAIILIGPEGDFTVAEIERALKAGYSPVALGATRLRTETAGVTAAVIMNI